MILGIKTKKEKEIEKLKELVDAVFKDKERNSKTIDNLIALVEILNDKNEKYSKINDDLNEKNKKLFETNQSISEENFKNSFLIKKLEKELVVTEERRRTNAAKLGGLTTSKNSLIEKCNSLEIKISEDREQKEKEITKYEKDMLFVLKLLFNKIKFEKHSKDYLRIKFANLEKKYSKKEGEVNVSINSK